MTDWPVNLQMNHYVFGAIPWGVKQVRGSRKGQSKSAGPLLLKYKRRKFPGSAGGFPPALPGNFAGDKAFPESAKERRPLQFGAATQAQEVRGQPGVERVEFGGLDQRLPKFSR